MPFLTNGRFLTTPEQVERLYRPLYRLRSLPPAPPARPVSGDVQPVGASEAPVPAERPSLPPVEAEDDAVWRANIDIAVWRRRWWWRLVGSIVVRRRSLSQ
jgi:hypothetical protein